MFWLSEMSSQENQKNFQQQNWIIHHLFLKTINRSRLFLSKSATGRPDWHLFPANRIWSLFCIHTRKIIREIIGLPWEEVFCFCESLFLTTRTIRNYQIVSETESVPQISKDSGSGINYLISPKMDAYSNYLVLSHQ